MSDNKAHHNRIDASAWVRRHMAAVPVGGPVVDLACGGGRHGRLFLDRGHPVTFVDRDVSAVADLADRRDAEIIEADLERHGEWSLSGRQFAGVVVTNYLWRPILSDIVALVAQEGVLIYETFAIGNEAFGRPRNPDFLLRPGELFEAVRGRLRVIAYDHRQIEKPRPAIVQRLTARRD